MNAEQIITEEARLTVLRELARQHNQAMTSEAARRYLLNVFLIDKPREWVELQFRFLEDVGAVVTVPAGDVLIARLTERGEQHVKGHISIPGVQRRSTAEQ